MAIGVAETYGAVLFDMDGVVVASEPLHEEAQRMVFARYALDVPESEFARFKGWTERRVYAYIAEHFGVGDTTVEALVEAKHAAYESISHKLTLVPGAGELITELSGAGTVLGLVTSAVRADQVRACDKFGLTDHFGTIISAEDVTHAKPHPEPYLTAANRLGVDPKTCLVIEDSLYGITAAIRAGCSIIGLAGTFSPSVLEESGADAVADSMQTIRTWLIPA